MKLVSQYVQGIVVKTAKNTYYATLEWNCADNWVVIIYAEHTHGKTKCYRFLGGRNGKTDRALVKECIADIEGR